MPRPYSEGEQILISKLIDYFTSERDAGNPLLPLTAVLERVSDALGVCLSTVKRINSTGIKSTKDETSASTSSRGNPFYRVHKHTVRNRIYAMFAAGEDHVTLFSIQTNLRNIDGLQISLSSLHRCLKELKFKWRKDTISNRKYLMEQPNIVEKRLRFLRDYHLNFNCTFSLKLIFLDETWIYSKGAFRNSWQDNSLNTVRKRTAEGVRYIILHAGCETGLVENASLIFKSGSKSGDYHDSMNHENFENWFKEKLIPNLEEPSLIIMDNAPYHSRLIEKIPNYSWTKEMLINWLKKNKIEFSSSDMKYQIWSTVKNNLPAKRYVVDELALQHGHRVLRLPPYHCQFNPIEMVWSECKRFYDSKITSIHPVTSTAILNLWNEALEKIPPEKWANYVNHTHNIISEAWDRDRLIDASNIQPVIIDLDESDSGSDLNIGSDDEL